MRKPRLLGATLALTTLLAGATAQADIKVGITAAVNPQAIGQPPTEPERMLLVGSDNFANEKITTGPEGQVQLLFVDGSSISVGPDANLTIDEYVYDSSTRSGKFAISATQGVFKLVGGAISKSHEILITTPVATAGIRGGIANFDARPNQPMHAQFLFGTSLRVTSQGVTQEATRPGFQITVLPGQPPSPPVKLTTAEVRGTLGQFQGRSRASSTAGPSGQGGPGGGQGGQEAPQDQALQQSGLSSVSGSNQPPGTLASLGLLTNPFAGVFNPNTLSILQNIVTQAAVTNEVAQNLGLQLFGHFYCCNVFLSGTFNTQTLADSPDPSNNFNFSAKVQGNNVTFTVPVSSSGQTQTFNVPFSAGTTSPFSAGLINGNSINGTLQVAADRQFFGIFGTVTLGPGQSCGGNSGNCKFGLFAGVPTPQPGQPNGLPTIGRATYSLNPIFDTIPFVNNKSSGGGGLGLPGVGNTGVSSSPLFANWSPVTNPAAAVGNDQRATWHQATLVISGSGAQQQSGLFGATGGFFQEQNSTVAMGGGVVGMARTSSGGVLTRIASGVSSAPIQTNTGAGNAIYGPNGEYIVAVPDILQSSPGNPLVRQISAQEQIPYDTLTNQQATNDKFFVTVAQQNAASSAPTQAVTTDSRTNQTLTGFTGGLFDSRASNGSITLAGAAPTFGGTVTIQTSADNNRMAAQFNFTDAGSNSYNLNFGSVSGFNDGRSSFSSDKYFAARDGVDQSGGPTSTFNGSTVAFSRMFMVSAATVPIDFQTFAGPGVTACTCSFMQWGWWVGELANPTGGARERFNLATWVAGVPPQASEVSVQTGTATYTGHAIGNVSSSVGGNYIAAGNYTQVWNFASHNGAATISQFDAARAGGPISASGSVSATGNGVTFGGTVLGSGVSGPIAGSFYKNVRTGDPVAGVGGNFALTGGGYRAAGTFAACKGGPGC